VRSLELYIYVCRGSLCGDCATRRIADVREPSLTTPVPPAGGGSAPGSPWRSRSYGPAYLHAGRHRAPWARATGASASSSAHSLCRHASVSNNSCASGALLGLTADGLGVSPLLGCWPLRLAVVLPEGNLRLRLCSAMLCSPPAPKRRSGKRVRTPNADARYLG
jgi:hypothetical protein